MQSVQPHDLIFGFYLEDIVLLNRALSSLPTWVSQLSFPYWGVVRRDKFTNTHIPIGIRGKSKSQRWGCWIAKQSIVEVLTPIDIKEKWLQKQNSFSEHPTFHQLIEIAKILNFYPFNWGITGSLGFQIATGQVVTHLQSDLDMIIYLVLKDPLEKLALLKCQVKHFSKLDVQIQTSYGAFSLKEWTTPESPVLFKRNTGPILASLEDFIHKAQV